MSQSLDELKLEFLEHSGVKGMKWGVRKKDPKPVTAEQQAKRDVKSAKFVTKADDYQATIDKLTTQRDATKNAYTKRSYDDMIKDTTKLKVTALKDADASKEGRLTSTQKKLIVGASVVAALVVARVVANNLENGQFNRLSLKGKAFIQGQKDYGFKKNLDLANPDLGIDDVHKLVVSKINPQYGAMGTKQNCRRATFAYEMRRRGNDVIATKTTKASGQNAVGMLNALSPGEKIRPTGPFGFTQQLAKEKSSRFTKGAKTPIMDMMDNFAAGGKTYIPDGSKAETLFDTLSKQPNGSRGEVGVMWRPGGGHSMAYEIFNGKAVIFDGQSGKKFTNAADFISEGMGNQVASAAFTRLDNIPLNNDFLLRWLKDA